MPWKIRSGWRATNDLLYSLILGSSKVFFAKAISSILGFGVSVLVARSLDPTNAGVYFLSITLVTLVATTCRLGLDSTIVKFVAGERLKGEWGGVSSYTIYFFRLVFISSLIVAILNFAVKDAGIYSHLFGKGFSESVTVVSVAIIFVCCLTVFAQVLQGLDRVFQSVVVLNVITPLCLLSVLVVSPVHSSGDVLKVYSLGAFIAMVAGLVFYLRALPKTRDARLTKKVDKLGVLESAKPLFFVSVMGQISQWAPQLFVGFYCASSDVAMLAVAQRVSMVISYVLISVNFSIAPRIVKYHRAGDTVELKRLVGYSGRLMLLVGFPFLFLCVFFSEFVISFFGVEYQQAAVALKVLAAGQFVNIFTGPVGYLLIMTNNEKEQRNSFIVGCFTTLLLSVMLIPSMSYLGGAIAVSVGVVLQNVFSAVRVNQVLGINVVSQVFLRHGRR